MLRMLAASSVVGSIYANCGARSERDLFSQDFASRTLFGADISADDNAQREYSHCSQNQDGEYLIEQHCVVSDTLWH